MGMKRRSRRKMGQIHCETMGNYAAGDQAVGNSSGYRALGQGTDRRDDRRAETDSQLHRLKFAITLHSHPPNGLLINRHPVVALWNHLRLHNVAETMRRRRPIHIRRLQVNGKPRLDLVCHLQNLLQLETRSA